MPDPEKTFQITATTSGFWSNRETEWLLSLRDDTVGTLQLTAGHKFAIGQPDTAVLNSRQFSLRVIGRNFMGTLNQFEIRDDEHTIWSVSLTGIMARNGLVRTDSQGTWTLKSKSLFSFDYRVLSERNEVIATITRLQGTVLGALFVADNPKFERLDASLLTWLVLRIWITQGS